MFLPLSGWALIVLGVPFGFFTIGNYAALGPFFTELFPTAIRASGQSFAYNFGKAAGAAAVSCIGILAQWISLAEAIGLIALVGYSIAFVATLMLPETRGIQLTSALLRRVLTPAFPLRQRRSRLCRRDDSRSSARPNKTRTIPPIGSRGGSAGHAQQHLG